jgi:hypothetical protein
MVAFLGGESERERERERELGQISARTSLLPCNKNSAIVLFIPEVFLLSFTHFLLTCTTLS